MEIMPSNVASALARFLEALTRLTDKCADLVESELDDGKCSVCSEPDHSASWKHDAAPEGWHGEVDFEV